MADIGGQSEDSGYVRADAHANTAETRRAADLDLSASDALRKTPPHKLTPPSPWHASYTKASTATFGREHPVSTGLEDEGVSSCRARDCAMHVRPGRAL